jgi:hypothetical protein
MVNEAIEDRAPTISDADNPAALRPGTARCGRVKWIHNSIGIPGYRVPNLPLLGHAAREVPLVTDGCPMRDGTRRA